jgi:iron complex outermembrane receptor protein
MNVGVDYEFDLDDMGRLTVGARYSYTDEMLLTTPNDVGFHRDELATVDAQIVWRSRDERYQLMLWGRNLSDEVERLGGTPVATLFAFASGTQPKQYGATFVMRFSE